MHEETSDAHLFAIKNGIYVIYPEQFQQDKWEYVDKSIFDSVMIRDILRWTYRFTAIDAGSWNDMRESCP